jgi:CBS domain-containing protein
MDANRVMTLDLTCIDEDTPLCVAWKTMQRLRVRHLPVLEQRRLVGIVSDRDLLLRAYRRPDGELGFPDLCAAEVMSFDPISCGPDAELSEIAAVMLEHRIDAVPITTEERMLVGLVTTADVLELVAARAELNPRPYTERQCFVQNRALSADDVSQVKPLPQMASSLQRREQYVPSVAPPPKQM